MNAVSRRFARTDAFFRNITRFAAFAVFGVLIGVIVSLYLGALPSIHKFGIGFLWTNAWNPVKENFGALAQIYGTFVSSACVAYGFRETPYTATEKDGVVTFTAAATNDKGATMSWKGTIKDGVLESTAVNKMPSGEATYAFKGKLGHGNEHPKNAEHPKKAEHPKN